MAENWTLLADLIPRVTNRVEDAAVEALGYILKKSPASLAALNSLVGDRIAMPEIKRVETQVSGAEGSRPDLTGFDSERKRRLLIEAKFWAGLTENQPNAYLNLLPDDGPATLLFVAPEARIPTLWPELERRAERKLLADFSGDGIRSANVDSTAKWLMMVSWTRMLNRMSERVREAQEDPGVAAGIEQLLGLARRMDDEEPLPLHQEEFAPQFARRVRNYMKLVDDVIQQGVTELWLNGRRRDGTTAWYGYGWQLQFNGATAWFGIRWSLWLQNGVTPLWLGQISEPVFNPVRDKLFPNLVGTWIPIHLKTGVEYSAVREDVVRQLKAIADAVNDVKASA